ncbi:MAG: hypothetical protein J1F66_04870 [Clostridiales bacterium]|nr:hypothetical protein [Clostridiales bacterium]
MIERNQLNKIYRKLDLKARDISERLKCAFAYYNGHYSKNTAGEYEMDCFPIPVVELKGVCDIAIELDKISVTTKLTRELAVLYNFEKLNSYQFEAYGVENYLDDFYVAGDTISGMKEKITRSKEQNVFFSFCFPFEVTTDTVYELVNFLSGEGFFY